MMCMGRKWRNVMNRMNVATKNLQPATILRDHQARERFGNEIRLLSTHFFIFITNNDRNDDYHNSLIFPLHNPLESFQCLLYCLATVTSSKPISAALLRCLQLHPCDCRMARSLNLTVILIINNSPITSLHLCVRHPQAQDKLSYRPPQGTLRI